jgi:hypothetical protein
MMITRNLILTGEPEAKIGPKGMGKISWVNQIQPKK